MRSSKYPNFPVTTFRWRCVSRRVFLMGLCGAMLMAAGCRPKTDTGPGADVKAVVEFAPHPPTVGVTELTVALTDAAGQPVRLGRLEVEGNMNHAGMRPVFAHLAETEPGRYAGKLEFTMGGDWFLLLTGRLPEGGRFDKKVDVPGVRSK